MECQFVVTYHVEEHAVRPTPVTYAELFEQVATAEQVGFDALWLAEHHFGAQEGVASQPLLVALAAAERTRRIAVGTSLLVLPLHHPLALAEQLATLDALLGDRLSIGFGSGSAEFEFAGFGVDFAAPVRHARFRESLDLLERAWSGRTFDFAGDFFRVPGVRLVPAPVRPLRDFAWIGAMSEATAATAGEFGYGLQLPRGRRLRRCARGLPWGASRGASGTRVGRRNRARRDRSLRLRRRGRRERPLRGRPVDRALLRDEQGL